jgi:RNA polymerase sigma-70 factor, ECF subfamily
VDDDSLSMVSDEQLAHAAGSDHAAFAELYRRHLPRIYRYVLARVGSVHDAQDLTAQTFEALLGSLATYQGKGSFAAWLTIIARNFVANHYRSRRPELSLDLLMDTPAAVPPTDEIVGHRLQLASVLSALNTLSLEYIEVVSLRIFGELSTAETAQIMGRSEAAVKMLLHRAIRDLRKQVGMKPVEEVDS